MASLLGLNKGFSGRIRTSFPGQCSDLSSYVRLVTLFSPVETTAYCCGSLDIQGGGPAACDTDADISTCYTSVTAVGSSCTAVLGNQGVKSIR